MFVISAASVTHLVYNDDISKNFVESMCKFSTNLLNEDLTTCLWSNMFEEVYLQ